MIYKGATSKKEKEEYAMAIRRNVIESMQTMIEAMDNLGIAWEDQSLVELAER